MRLPRPSLSPLLPLLIALAVLPHGAHANSIPLRLIADPAGENDGDSFGVSVASVGDLNGEGYDDLLVGANYYPTLSGRGRAYVYFGGHAPDAVPDRVFTGAASGDQLGSVVGSAGDVNGDGFPDVFAVASYNDAGGTDAGAVYVWFGGPAFDTTADLTILGSGANQRILFADGAGDVNGDGYSDLIVSQKDHADVFLGGSAPNAIPDVTIARSFAAVGGAGDVNGDGIDDFVLGDPGDDTGGVDAGKVYVYYGGTTIDTVEDETYVGDRPGRYLGRRVGRAGRIDGSNLADVFASAAEDPENVGYDRGRVYLLANSETTDVPMTPVQGLAFVGATPNPAWSDVSLSFSLDHAVRVRVSVYDVAGREVARPVSDEQLEGRVTRVWRPRALASGVYYVSTRMGGHEQARKLIWLGHTR